MRELASGLLAAIALRCQQRKDGRVAMATTVRSALAKTFLPRTREAACQHQALKICLSCFMAPKTVAVFTCSVEQHDAQPSNADKRRLRRKLAWIMRSRTNRPFRVALANARQAETDRCIAAMSTIEVCFRVPCLLMRFCASISHGAQARL
eukprot:CAMPEP_0169246268 /NCGR_PEP_ID=MMETSP1016-20121227/34641_1 /TAXON_ID=342587 /ORGANISM="Karlodinium micrum, Strain CCMP2283" /LENGTH=150 /DNA_ID=CAMNT_0009326831 /DNA_START=114 /DNA_END=566 /DNA_ORIENTATION=-